MSKSIREIYNISQEAKVLLYIGNISNNKNQVQIVRSYGLLPDEVRKHTYVLFCGEDHAQDGEMENTIANMLDADHLILCGGVDKSMMPNYYKEADGVVLLSYAEGFGLSLIEGMHFGLPGMMFCDMDAFEEIYDERAIIGLKMRGDEVVANGLKSLLLTKWDKETIKGYSIKFSSANMAI